jgi:hypothetical protein
MAWWCAARCKKPCRFPTPRVDYTTEAPSVYTADTYQKAAANLVGMYAPGTHHPLRYNPRDPRDIRFGIIQFGPLAFAFLLLIGGAVLSGVGLNSRGMAYSPRAEPAPVKEQGVPATVLPFPDQARQEPSAATLGCPSCGRPVKVTADTCPNCLKSLRAA